MIESEYKPSSKESLSFSEKRDRIAGLYKNNWKGGRVSPFMPEVVAYNGESLEKNTGASSGNMITEIVETKDCLIRSVPTDTGYVAIGSPDMITKELVGCMGVLVLGRTKDGRPLSSLTHLTPKSRLGWGNFKNEGDEKRWGHETRSQIAETVIEMLAKSGADLEHCQAILVRAAGLPPNENGYNGYTEDHQKEKTDELVKELEGRGLKTNALEPLAMENATIYWSSESPDELFAIGENRIENPEGGVDEPSQKEKTVITKIIAKILR